MVKSKVTISLKALTQCNPDYRMLNLVALPAHRCRHPQLERPLPNKSLTFKFLSTASLASYVLPAPSNDVRCYIVSRSNNLSCHSISQTPGSKRIDDQHRDGFNIFGHHTLPVSYLPGQFSSNLEGQLDVSHNTLPRCYCLEQVNFTW